MNGRGVEWVLKIGELQGLQNGRGKNIQGDTLFEKIKFLQRMSELESENEVLKGRLAFLEGFNAGKKQQEVDKEPKEFEYCFLEVGGTEQLNLAISEMQKENWVYHSLSDESGEFFKSFLVSFRKPKEDKNAEKGL